MSEAGHRYTFGYSREGACSRCGSPDHWTLHCPEEVPARVAKHGGTPDFDDEGGGEGEETP